MTYGTYVEPGQGTPVGPDESSRCEDECEGNAPNEQPRDSRRRNKSPASLGERLLTVPPRKRTNSVAHFYICYSRKNGQRVHMESMRRFELFVRLECDPNIRRLNMAVHEASAIDGEPPAAVSLDQNNRLTVHTFAGVKGETEGQATWESWCKQHGFLYLQWRPKDLFDQPILQSNRKALLRFVTRADSLPDEVLKHSLLNELVRVRRATFAHMLRFGEARPRDEVQAAVADLLLDGDISSDIDEKPLSMGTMMEATHA